MIEVKKNKEPVLTLFKTGSLFIYMIIFDLLHLIVRV